jgi:3-hydroxyisobutyrate dehydrogenase-like beta-hydroxyacid dehydrogenase
MTIARIALIGFGEVGQILGADLAERGVNGLAAWDIKFSAPTGGPSRAMKEARTLAEGSATEAVRGADLVISAVTAAQTVEAAASAAPGLKKDAFFLDLNSASPGMKIQAMRLIEQAGGRYVEAAVMSPISPKRIATSILLGGPHAEEFIALARDLGFAGMKVFSPEVGKASAAKMCRSVMVKGIESLLSEALLSARRYGVEDTVVTSLSDLFPGPDWASLSRYMISRSLEHGTRRAEEMREVAKTVEEAGLSPLMSSACAERQDRAAAFAYALKEQDLHKMLDAILEGAGPERPL